LRKKNDLTQSQQCGHDCCVNDR